MIRTGNDPFASPSSSEIGTSLSEARGGTGFAGGMVTSSQSYIRCAKIQNEKAQERMELDLLLSSSGADR